MFNRNLERNHETRLLWTESAIRRNFVDVVSIFPVTATKVNYDASSAVRGLISVLRILFALDRGTGADCFAGEQIFRDERRENTIGILRNVESTQN